MTYILAATAALVLFILAGWRSRQRRSQVARAAATLVNSPAGAVKDQPPADVTACLNLALKRLLPVMTGRGVRADVAVRPGLLVRLPGMALADLLEDLVAAAIHHAQTSRLLLTAAEHGEWVDLGVTDDAPDADAKLRAENVSNLAERVSQLGGRFRIEVRPTEGTTMTLRLAAAAQTAEAEIDVAGMSPAPTRPISRLVSTRPMVAHQRAQS